MKVVVVGQSGINKMNYLREVERYSRDRGKKVKIYNISEEMKEEYYRAFKKNVNMEKILQLEMGELTLLRRNALRRLIANSKEEENSILNTHMVFRSNFGLFYGFDIDLLREFNPDVFITIIDDIDEIQRRLLKRGKKLTLRDILHWREEEMITSDIVVNFLKESLRKEIKHYVIARAHSPEVIYKIIFEADRYKTTYLSFPITGLSEEDKPKVEKYKKLVKKYFIAFDPYKIYERYLISALASLEDDIERYVKRILKDIPFSHLQNIEPESTFIKKLSQEEIKDIIRSKLKIKIKNTRPEREDEIIGSREVINEFEVGEIESLKEGIDGRIIFRDFFLIDQSELFMMYIDVDKNTNRPRISAGCQTELKYAYNKTKEIFIICKNIKDLSPWVTRFVPESNQFSDLEEFFEELKERRYIREEE